MNLYEKVSTGLSGFDQVIDYLRFGDNVVWQVDSVSGYKEMVGHFAESARAKNMSLVYIRFADHEPLLDADRFLKIYHIDARKGFESFAIEIHNIINKEGTGVFYVFDCLTDLLEYWYSDLMIGNFLKPHVHIYMNWRLLHILPSGEISIHIVPLPVFVKLHSFFWIYIISKIKSIFTLLRYGSVIRLPCFFPISFKAMKLYA